MATKKQRATKEDKETLKKLESPSLPIKPKVVVKEVEVPMPFMTDEDCEFLSGWCREFLQALYNESENPVIRGNLQKFLKLTNELRETHEALQDD